MGQKVNDRSGSKKTITGLGDGGRDGVGSIGCGGRPGGGHGVAADEGVAKAGIRPGGLISNEGCDSSVGLLFLLAGPG